MTTLGFLFVETADHLFCRVFSTLAVNGFLKVGEASSSPLPNDGCPSRREPGDIPVLAALFPPDNVRVGRSVPLGIDGSCGNIEYWFCLEDANKNS